MQFGICIGSTVATLMLGELMLFVEHQPPCSPICTPINLTSFKTLLLLVYLCVWILLVTFDICSFPCQGEPGPRGESGREGSAGENGDPVRDSDTHSNITKHSRENRLKQELRALLDNLLEWITLISLLRYPFFPLLGWEFSSGSIFHVEEARVRLKLQQRRTWPLPCIAAAHSSLHHFPFLILSICSLSGNTSTHSFPSDSVLLSICLSQSFNMVFLIGHQAV